MNGLDLSKAVEAIRDIFEDRAAFIAVPPNADLSEEEILTATLPHILDALAEQAVAEAEVTRCAMVELSAYVMPNDHAELKAVEDAARWLRAYAEEMRRG